MKKVFAVLLGMLTTYGFVASADFVDPVPNSGQVVKGVWVPNQR
jgi:hypothetical protein